MTPAAPELGERDEPASQPLDLGGTRLRPVRQADAAALFGHVHDQPSVTRWLCWDGPAGLAELEDRYRAARLDTASGPIYVYAVADGATDAPIGEGTLRFDGHPGIGDLGFWLGSAHHGAGHGGRAVELLVYTAFETLGAHAVTAQVKEGNLRSLRVLERAGFVRERAPGAGTDAPAANSDGGEAAADTLPDRIAWILSLTRRGFRKRTDRPTPARPPKSD